MSITFIQTSDTGRYFKLLSETSKTIMKYCDVRGFSYIQFVGLKVGRLPWMASYNRIFLLKELLDYDFSDWAIYLDSDSYIVDMDFDILAYLDNNARYGAIFAGHLEGSPHRINSGGFAINFGHPVGRQIVSDYFRIFKTINADKFAKAIWWERDIPEDQWLLHMVLKKYIEETGLESQILFEKYGDSIVNSGPFIKQALRSDHSGFDARLAAVKSAVQAALGAAPKADEGELVLSVALPHPRFHTDVGEIRDSGIHTCGDAPGRLLYGPHVAMRRGRYRACIRGELATKPPGPVQLDLEVTYAHAAVDPGRESITLRERGPFSVGLQYELMEDVSDFECRVFLKSPAVGRLFEVSIVRL